VRENNELVDAKRLGKDYTVGNILHLKTNSFQISDSSRELLERAFPVLFLAFIYK